MSKRTRQFGRGCLSLFVLVSGTAAAGDVTMQSSLSVSGTLTDNITRGQIQSDGSPVSKGDFITEIRPSIGGRSQGAGLKYDFNYELSAVEYFHDTARNAVNNRFRLNGTAEVVEDRFLLEPMAVVPAVELIGDPPVLTGAVQSRSMKRSPGVPVRSVGVPGVVLGVTGSVADDGRPGPAALIAEMRNRYSVPLVNPEIVAWVLTDPVSETCGTQAESPVFISTR